MANGDTVRFGRWITNSGDYIYDNYDEINLSYYKSVQLDTDYTDDNALTWVEGQIDGHKYYFAKHLLINYMSYNKARQLCNNTYTINGNEYELTLLTRSRWKSLPFSVYSNLQYPTLYGDGGLQEYIFTSETRYSNVYGAYRTLSDQAFSTELIPTERITDFNTTSGYVYFAPVLVQSNTVKFGTCQITKDDGTTEYLSGYSKINPNAWGRDYKSFTITDTIPGYEIEWLQCSYNNKNVYVPKYSLFTGVNGYEYNESCDKLVTIDNKTYRMYGLTKNNIVRNNEYDSYIGINNDAFKIPYEDMFFDNDGRDHGICTIDRGNETDEYAWHALFYMPSKNGDYGFWDSRIYDFSNSSNTNIGHQSFRTYVYLVEETPNDGDIVEMGMTYDFYNGYNHTAGMETIYPVDGFTRVYDINEDDNIVRTLKIVDYNSRYTDEPPMEWVAYNYQNKLYYISRTTFIWGYIQDTFDICNNNKAIFLNGKYYEMTTMPIEFWTNLPSSVKNNMEITSLRMHTDSEVQVSIPNEGMQTGYRTVSFDANEIKFVESMPVVPGKQGEAGCAFIPVLVEKYSDLNIVKMGTWRLLRDDAATLDQYASYYSKGTCYMDNYKYVQLRDENSYSGDAIAEMIEYIYNGEKLYIPLFAALRCTNKEANKMVRGCFFDLNDDEVYVGRYMPKDFWINLPSEIMSLVIDGINSDGRIIEDGYLLGIDEYSNTTDKIHKAVAYNKTNNRFEESNSTLSNTQPCCMCIPVMGPYTKYEVTRMGILKDSSTGTTYNQKDIISNVNTKPYLSYDKITFVDTDNKSEQWKWIKHVYNNEIYYICTSLCSANFGNSDLLNIKEREIVFGNGKFKFCGLSPYEKNPVFLYSEDFLKSDMAYFLKPPGESIRLYGTGTDGAGNDAYYFRDIDDYYIGFSSYTTSWPGYGEQTGNYFPILKLLNSAPTISGVDSNLGDKTQSFSIEYTVDDTDSRDTLTITEKLNGTTIRTINSAVRNQEYSFNITSSMFANLALYETNTVEITVNDGIATATRTYTFRKTNTAPVINYTGSDNLGIINSKPTIRYTVTDAEGDDITITERLNGKVLQTYTVSSGTSCTVNIPNMSWLGCGNSTNTIEINARDTAGGSSNKTITFTRAIDRIEVITNPIKTDKAVTKISLEVGWNTENASGQVFVCNNAYDASPTWENMTNSVGSNLVYNITNTTKTAAEWGVSVKVIVKKDGGSTGEVSLYSIKGTYE